MKSKNLNAKQDGIIFRRAVSEDLPHIILLLGDDPLGQARENTRLPPAQSYIDAMEEIIRDNNTELLVVENAGDIVGVAQINYLRYLTYQGGLRAQIEGVRIHKDYQGQGLGKKLFQDLIDRAKTRKCHLVQLTTDKARPDALVFYERLGFKQSHLGLKLHL
jgi:GNAT superfamily N-acetyltransferase